LRELCTGCIREYPPGPAVDVAGLRAAMTLSPRYYAACDWDKVAATYEAWIGLRRPWAQDVPA
jgi:hypothetical protein